MSKCLVWSSKNHKQLFILAKPKNFSKEHMLHPYDHRALLTKKSFQILEAFFNLGRYHKIFDVEQQNNWDSCHDRKVFFSAENEHT
jgi:hypothetical protein